MSGTCEVEGCANRADVDVAIHVRAVAGSDTFHTCMEHVSGLLRKLADINDEAEISARQTLKWWGS